MPHLHAIGCWWLTDGCAYTLPTSVGAAPYAWGWLRVYYSGVAEVDMYLGSDVVRFADFLEREVWRRYIEEGDYFAIQYDTSRGPAAWQLGIAGSHDELIKLILDWVRAMEADGDRNHDRAMIALQAGSLIQVHA